MKVVWDFGMSDYEIDEVVVVCVYGMVLHAGAESGKGG